MFFVECVLLPEIGGAVVHYILLKKMGAVYISWRFCRAEVNVVDSSKRLYPRVGGFCTHGRGLPRRLGNRLSRVRCGHGDRKKGPRPSKLVKVCWYLTPAGVSGFTVCRWPTTDLFIAVRFQADGSGLHTTLARSSGMVAALL
ncbi:unnamed protein product [Ectocarpus sp. 12 AP-2014]